MKTIRWIGVLLAAACLLPPLLAQAQNARAARAQVEASMLVTGHVDIEPDGSVGAHALDRPDELPPYVVDLIARAVPALRFEPVVEDGVPVRARARMSVRLVATPADEGNMNIRVQGVHFGEASPDADVGGVRSAEMRPPQYPANILRMGGKGTVYLLLKVGRDGRVEDAVAEQVNLTAIGSARQMETIRDALARVSIDAARDRWRFVPPTEGDEAARDYWVVRVPVEFELGDDRKPAYGQWAAYHPGPRNRPDWARPTPEGFSPDALVAGQPTPETSRFRLLTPLEG